jgi:hypothetical protein
MEEIDWGAEAPFDGGKLLIKPPRKMHGKIENQKKHQPKKWKIEKKKKSKKKMILFKEFSILHHNCYTLDIFFQFLLPVDFLRILQKQYHFYTLDSCLLEHLYYCLSPHHSFCHFS